MEKADIDDENGVAKKLVRLQKDIKKSKKERKKGKSDKVQHLQEHVENIVQILQALVLDEPLEKDKDAIYLNQVTLPQAPPDNWGELADWMDPNVENQM